MSVRAVVMPGPRKPLEVQEFSEPQLEDGGILLETVASEVCGTDVHLHHGRLAEVPYPIVPGHVSVGRVAGARGVETDALGRELQVGDPVTFLDVHGTCHRCHYCRVARQPNLCPERRVYGITLSAEEGLFGGWAERIHLKPGVHVLRLPDGVDTDRLIGGGCGLFTGFAAVERADPAMGETVLVQGAGPVGLAAAGLARLRGAERVLVIGAPEARLDLARSMGAAETFALDGTSPAERRQRVLELTGGRGADAAIEATGNPEALPEGLNLVRPGGRYVVAGHYTDAGTVELNPHRAVNRKHVEIRGQWGTDLHHLVGALRILSHHGEELPFERIVGRRYGLGEAGKALQDVENLRVTKAVIVPGED